MIMRGVIIILLIVGAIGMSKSFTSEATAGTSTHPKDLQGYWAMQIVKVDGKTDSEEPGVYLVIRADETFRIVKLGRKPEGKWAVDANNRLVLTAGDVTIMKADWEIKEGNLTVSYEDRGKKVVLKYKKEDLKREPKGQDED